MNIQNRPVSLTLPQEAHATPAPSSSPTAGGAPAAARSPSPSRSAASAGTPEPAPFDELKLDSPMVRKSIEKLQRKGYFTIPVSETTKTFMHAQKAENAQEIFAGTAVSFRQTVHEPVITAAATKVMSAINGHETRLTTHECEVRWPAGTGASDWHRDSRPKVLTCLTTLEGRPTEFVSPQVAQEKFTTDPKNPATVYPTRSDGPIASDIRQAKKDKFYFFAAAGVTADHIPKLVHRAPGDAGRSIFLARWKEAKKQTE